MEKSARPQYICHLNILGYPNLRPHESVLVISMEESLMITVLCILLRFVRNVGIILSFLSHLRVGNSYSGLNFLAENGGDLFLF